MKKRPYWLAAGPERCHACSFSHVREMEIRCSACDRGFCAGCVVLVRETLEWLCSKCSADGEEES